MREVMIIIHVHALYQTLLSCIQSIFVSLILRYIKKLLKFKSNDDSNRVYKKMNNERLIVQDLCNDLSYHHEKLRIQFYINWKTENNEWEWDWNDNIMLSNLIFVEIVPRSFNQRDSELICMYCSLEITITRH